MGDVTSRAGVRLYFLDEGVGQPVLLIHGHTLDLRVWDPVVEELVAAGLCVIRYDLRGHGRSDRPARGYHWADHAADAAAVLDAAAVARAPVVGYSIGGGIALELALTMPDRVSSLILLSPVLPDRDYEPEFFASLRDVARATRRDGIRAAMLGPWLESPLWRGSIARPGVRERLAELVADFPGAEYLAVERDRVERAWTVPGRLPEITVPTLVAAGELELPGFRSWAAAIAEGITGSQLELLAGLGHLHLLEDPALVATLIVSRLLEGTGDGGYPPDPRS